jgi:polyisoprenyl-teichoic acid--peptidoglycan teichoic acid transferase
MSLLRPLTRRRSRDRHRDSQRVLAVREPLATPPRVWKRLLIGAFLVIAATAATTAAAGFNELHGFVNALNQTRAPELGNALTPPSAGAPQTILLMGSDKRANGARDAGSPPHTDTMMLVRADPNRGALTTLSIPRDLAVTLDVPHHGSTREKINAAYTFGGEKLALETVESTLGIKVNHLVDTNFAGFKAMVDYLGCVYVDVDRHYFNDNAGPSSQQYATINVPAGYQKLCGQDALDYVRYRHDDNDFVRVARQQDFLRQIKDQIGTRRLVEQRLQLARIFGSTTATDIHSTNAVLRLLEVLVLSAGHPIRQVHFRANVGPSYVTATPDQIHQTVADFLSSAPAASPTRAAPARSAPPGRHRGPSAPTLEQVPSLAQAAAANLTAAGIPIFYPRLLRVGAIYAADSRIYTVNDLHGRPHHAYRLVAQMASPGDYYGIEGTDWRNPPILAHPSETRIIGGRRFQLFYTGSHLRLVAWRSGGDTYWLSNTLLQTLSDPEMLAIAASTRPLG